MTGRLDGKIAIITGASTGIGSATVRLFVAEGAKVVAADIKDPGDMLQAAVADNAGSLVFRTLDVRSEEAWADALGACVETFGQPNVLINNAGIGSSGKPVHEESLDAMRANFEVNTVGMFLGMKTVIPGMMEMGGGAIVNVASVWGWTGIKNNVAYQTAKGAAVMLSKNAAVTYAPNNIRVNCVLPGYIDTPMSRTVTPEEAQMLMDFTPLGRRAEPEEVAPMFVFLASDEAGFVAAGNYFVDGGMSAL
ncbi:SDR family NAD(P)-dependent oxidoreductase [Bauldia litoralis]|uniref:NAD(P)-dependent dehydrogenase, short-chain alcohol dehydrogenase family n=1 Tax=Bauldia litoralis TaxID=665467 RepID=A0A1G6E6D3_9HYPH|nr:glucose 1-dehydrogenase [Bauldia litoralis]SDB53017.1 NAD(P)-dependent dehydrogenase, short-chain alcohol dehydrogenase family [Bauldia litoralis]